MNLLGHNIIVIDTECLRSASECRICGAMPAEAPRGLVQAYPPHRCQPLGWENRVALGLSIGCAYRYAEDRFEFFDLHTLEQQPLLVSFNGFQHDFPLMRGLLKHQANTVAPEDYASLHATCDVFQALGERGYDILDQIWQQDPIRKFEHGLNSLDALCQANGLPAKEMDGATAPRLWQQGRYAEVITYCMNDVRRTRGLFKMLCTSPSHSNAGMGVPFNYPCRIFFLRDTVRYAIVLLPAALVRVHVSSYGKSHGAHGCDNGFTPIRAPQGATPRRFMAGTLCGDEDRQDDS